MAVGFVGEFIFQGGGCREPCQFVSWQRGVEQSNPSGMLTKFETKTSRVKGLSFHPKRTWVLASLHNGSVQIWDYRMGTVVDTYTEHDGPVRGCAFHPTQPLFATCGDDHKVKVWNYQQKKCLFTLTGHQDYIRSIAFHHESPWLMTASDDQTIRIWNWQSRTCVAQLTGHSHYVMCAQFHPKDDLVVSASLDQTIRVWDIGHLKRKGSMTPVDEGGRAGHIDLFAGNDGQVRYVLEGHDRGVNWVQFHPTKPLIVSGSDDRSVKLWRYNDSRAWETDTFRGHFNNVSCVVFHPTADLIVSASEDKTLRIWDYSKRGTAAQVVKRESDRYWMLAVHPTLGTFVAGHDSGMQVFKLERERPPQLVLDDGLFFVRGATLVRRDLNKAAGGETNLITLAQPPALPATLDYSAADKAFLVSSGNEYELASRSSKRGTGAHAMFLPGGRFLTLDAPQQQLVIRSVAENAVVSAVPAPIAGLEHVFPAPGAAVLLCSATGVGLYDVPTNVVAYEAAIAKVRRVAWSADGTRGALMSKKSRAGCRVPGSAHGWCRCGAGGRAVGRRGDGRRDGQCQVGGLGRGRALLLHDAAPPQVHAAERRDGHHLLAGQPALPGARARDRGPGAGPAGRVGDAAGGARRVQL